MPRMVQISARPYMNENVGDKPKVKVTAEGFMGKTEMLLPLSLGQLQQGIEKWDAGAYVQDAFPTLNAVQREFLMTGLSDTEQERVFAHPEADEDTPI